MLGLIGWIVFVVLVAIFSACMGYLAYGFSVMMGMGRLAPIVLGILAAAFMILCFIFVSVG